MKQKCESRKYLYNSIHRLCIHANAHTHRSTHNQLITAFYSSANVYPFCHIAETVRSNELKLKMVAMLRSRLRHLPLCMSFSRLRRSAFLWNFPFFVSCGHNCTIGMNYVTTAVSCTAARYLSIQQITRNADYFRFKINKHTFSWRWHAQCF